MEIDKEQNRKLSKAEKIRSENFEKIKKQLIGQGYEMIDLTVSLVYANIMAFVLSFPVILCLFMIFIKFNGMDFAGFLQEIAFQYILSIIVFVLVFFALILAHELIHGITWSIFAEKHWEAISFGFIAEYMTPYCTCDEALKKSQYIIGTLMPTVILGVIPAIISIVTGSGLMFGMSAIMILSGGGDLTIVMNLLKFRSDAEEKLYIDHPYRAGLVAFVKKLENMK